MNKDNDLNASEAASARIAAAPREAGESGRHFLLPWQLSADTAHWQQGDDAGCGNCPVD